MTTEDRDDTEPVRVLFIAGKGRSGSTLLCRTLGAIDGFVGTGEFMQVLRRGVLSGDECSCGTPVGSCEFWGEVRRDLERRCPDLDLERLERTKYRVTETWGALRYLFLPHRNTALGRDLEDLRAYLAELCRSIRAVSGAQVVVDASKNPVFLSLLTETRGIRVTVVQLVRDSRGVAHSLRKKRLRAGTVGRVEFMYRNGPLVASFLWSAANVMTERVGRRTGRIYRVRYEDFVSDPRSTIATVLREVQPTSLGRPVHHVTDGSVRVGTDHLIGSNPNRSRRGDIELREDVAWKTEMGFTRRWLVTTLTCPLLRRYGYGIRTQPRPMTTVQHGSRARRTPSTAP